MANVLGVDAVLHDPAAAVELPTRAMRASGITSDEAVELALRPPALQGGVA